MNKQEQEFVESINNKIEKSEGKYKMTIKEMLDKDTKILVIDVESTCWNNKEEQGNQPNEIIQIGYCFINGNTITGKGQIIIKPKFSKVSKYCTELTGLTQKQVDKGLETVQGYSKLKGLFKGINTWASYGDYDRNIIIRMCDLYKIRHIVDNKKHINVRKECAIKIKKSNDPKSASNNPKISMEEIGMKFEGRNHDGEDDAFNIARLLLKLQGMK